MRRLLEHNDFNFFEQILSKCFRTFMSAPFVCLDLQKLGASGDCRMETLTRTIKFLRQNCVNKLVRFTQKNYSHPSLVCYRRLT